MMYKNHIRAIFIKKIISKAVPTSLYLFLNAKTTFAVCANISNIFATNRHQLILVVPPAKRTAKEKKKPVG